MKIFWVNFVCFHPKKPILSVLFGGAANYAQRLRCLCQYCIQHKFTVGIIKISQANSMQDNVS